MKRSESLSKALAVTGFLLGGGFGGMPAGIFPRGRVAGQGCRAGACRNPSGCLCSCRRCKDHCPRTHFKETTK